MRLAKGFFGPTNDFRAHPLAITIILVLSALKVCVKNLRQGKASDISEHFSSTIFKIDTHERRFGKRVYIFAEIVANTRTASDELELQTCEN